MHKRQKMKGMEPGFVVQEIITKENSSTIGSGPETDKGAGIRKVKEMRTVCE